MPSFTVESSSHRLDLARTGDGHGGSIRLTVRNGAVTARTCRLRIVPQEGALPDWFSVTDDTQYTLEPNESTQVELQVAVPAGAPAGRRGVRLDAIEVSNPEEDIARGPDIAFDVPEPEPERAPFPWAIAIGAAVVVLVLSAGLITYALWPRSVTVQNVVGMPLDAARGALEGLAVQTSTVRTSEYPGGTVASQRPEGGAQVAPGSTVELGIAAGASAPPQRGEIDFTDRRSTSRLSPNALRRQGISRVVAAPEGSYCAGAVPMILGPGKYRAPTSFLSTGEPGDPDRCNTVPLRFELANPARRVTVSFWGAASDYELIGYGRSSRGLVRSTAQGAPYEYGRAFEVSVGSQRGELHAFTFGKQASLTMIRSITLE